MTYNNGSVPTDDSGTIQLVRVEFAGYAPIKDQEFNSFSFAAVGSGTRASYLESLNGLDDAFHFYGGGFDLDHLIALEAGDDMFAMTEGFSGRLQYLIGVNTVQPTPRTGAGAYANDVQGIALDGCAGNGCGDLFDSTPLTQPMVANFTIIGCGLPSCMGSLGGQGIVLRRGAAGYFVNGVAVRWSTNGVALRDSATYSRTGSTTKPQSNAALQLRNLTFAEVNKALFEAPADTLVYRDTLVTRRDTISRRDTIVVKRDSVAKRDTTIIRDTVIIRDTLITRTDLVPSKTRRFVLDSTFNNLSLLAGSATSLFTAIPSVGAAPTGISSFDFTPVPGSPIATGGATTFTGVLATKAGTFIVPTPYRGAAAPGGIRWWAGWTSYTRN